jgi:hypothetical protein
MTTKRHQVTADQARTLVRGGDLGRWAREAAARQRDSRGAESYTKAAHGYIYNGLTLARPGLVFDAWLEYERELREEAMEETCPHGLSAWLCADPVYHYPPDREGGSYY